MVFTHRAHQVRRRQPHEGDQPGLRHRRADGQAPARRSAMARSGAEPQAQAARRSPRPMSRPSSTRRERSTPPATQTAQAAAITASALQSDEGRCCPRRKACIACRLSADSSSMRSVAERAQHHADDHARPAAAAASAARRAPAPASAVPRQHRAGEGRARDTRAAPSHCVAEVERAVERQRRRHAQRGARGAAEQIGIGQRVAEQPCDKAPGEAQQRAGEPGAQRARQADVPARSARRAGRSMRAARCRSPCCPRPRPARRPAQGPRDQQGAPTAGRAGAAPTRGRSWGRPRRAQPCVADAVGQQRALSAMRGPGRTTMSDCAADSTQMRCLPHGADIAPARPLRHAGERCAR